MYTPKYFKLEEFLRSSTATIYGIANTPTFEAVQNLSKLCELVLDPAREKLGMPILISSGYRSNDVNQRVGGVSNSQHVKGCAVDLVCNDMDKLFNILKTYPHIDQLLYEKTANSRWLHVSISDIGKPRNYINDNYVVK